MYKMVIEVIPIIAPKGKLEKRQIKIVVDSDNGVLYSTMSGQTTIPTATEINPTNNVQGEKKSTCKKVHIIRFHVCKV